MGMGKPESLYLFKSSPRLRKPALRSSPRRLARLASWIPAPVSPSRWALIPAHRAGSLATRFIMTRYLAAAGWWAPRPFVKVLPLTFGLSLSTTSTTASN